jgi:nucleoside-diphosphate-sugar epimerase
VARALIVGCGCRGRALGGALLDAGWTVRGTSRDQGHLAAIEAAGIEPALADPLRPGSVLDLVGDVAVVHWLMGSARGAEEAVEAIHGTRLERLLERLVDTPVRGFVYEGAGSVRASLLAGGAATARRAGGTWRIPVAVVEADPGAGEAWLDAALAATPGLAPTAGEPKRLNSDGN